MKKGKYSTCECDCCHAKIPLSSAFTPEGRDYVHHFCGSKCFDQWKKIKSKQNKK